MRSPEQLKQLHYHSSEALLLSHEVRPARHRGPQHACHENNLELCLIEHGEEYATIEGRTDLHCAGQYSLIPAGMVHSSWTRARPVQESIIHLPSLRIHETADQLGIDTPLSWPSSPFATPPVLVHLVSAIKQESRQDPSAPGYELAMESMCTALIVLLLRRHIGEGALLHKTQARGTHARLQDVAEIMRSDLARKHSLEQLAGMAGLSRFHFLRQFKKIFGMPPHTYVTKNRLDRAFKLINDTEMSLTSISQDLGFGSSSRLTEAFKTRFGVTPSRWRAEHRGASSGKPDSNICVAIPAETQIGRLH